MAHDPYDFNVELPGSSNGDSDQLDELPDNFAKSQIDPDLGQIQSYHYQGLHRCTEFDPHLGSIEGSDYPLNLLRQCNDNLISTVPTLQIELQRPLEHGEPEKGSPPAGPSNSVLDHALAMANRGYRVLPCRAGGKIPVIQEWQHRATVDPAIIREWFRLWPDANYGIAGGQGILIVDIDVKGAKDGLSTLAALEAEHGPLPDTLKVRTPSGGLHIYLCGENVSNTAGHIGSGIDIRSAGGQVVGPGCQIGNQRYVIESDLKPALAPDWLVRMTGETKLYNRDAAPVQHRDAPADIERSRRYLINDAKPAIQGQGGDTQTYKVACALHEMGLTEATALEQMIEFFNPRCQPPWDEVEMVIKVTNAFSFAQNKAASKSSEALAAYGGDPSDVLIGESSPLNSSILGKWLDIDTQLIPVQWIVKELLPVEGTGFITGLPNAGKSALVFDLADAISSSQTWFGKNIKRQSGTIVLAFEGGRAHTILRLKALRVARSAAPPAISVCYLD